MSESDFEAYTNQYNHSNHKFRVDNKTKSIILWKSTVALRKDKCKSDLGMESIISGELSHAHSEVEEDFTDPYVITMQATHIVGGTRDSHRCLLTKKTLHHVKTLGMYYGVRYRQEKTLHHDVRYIH